MAGRPPLHGYNTNYRKKGLVYHVQTEDLGKPICAIVTQVFTGGTILAKERTEYKDIVDEKNVEVKLREMMQRQHKTLLIALRDGKIDTSVAEVVEQPAPKKPTTVPPPPTPFSGDPLRDTVQMELPPEFYEEIVDGAPADDELIIEDFPPPDPPQPPQKKNFRDKIAPAQSTQTPPSAPFPAIRVTPSSHPQTKIPPPPPPGALAASKGKRDSQVFPKASPNPSKSVQVGTPISFAKKPKIFAEISRPTRGLGEEQIGERSLDEVILSYLAEDLQDD